MLRYKFYLFIYFFCVYIKLVNKYYQKFKERLRKAASEEYENLFEKKRKKVEKRYERDIKLSLKKKNKSCMSI